MKLNNGDLIGYISPSSPVTATAPDRTKRTASFLEEKGFRLKPGKLTGEQDYFIY